MIDPGIVTDAVLYCHVGNKELSALHQVFGRDRWMSSKVTRGLSALLFSHFNRPSIHHACGARSPPAIGFPSHSASSSAPATWSCVCSGQCSMGLGRQVWWGRNWSCDISCKDTVLSSIWESRKEEKAKRKKDWWDGRTWWGAGGRRAEASRGPQDAPAAEKHDSL